MHLKIWIIIISTIAATCLGIAATETLWLVIPAVFSLTTAVIQGRMATQKMKD